MKVLMFGWEFPPYNSGGLGTACQGLTRALSNLNTEIIFVLPRTLPITSPFVKLVFADSKVSFKDLHNPLSAYLSEPRFRELKDKFSYFGKDLYEEVRRYALAGRMIAQEEDFDLIHAHDWLTYGAGIEAKRVSGKPLIVHVHATEFDRSGDNIDERIYEIEKEGMEAADEIIAVSNYTKNLIVERYGINPDKIQVVWNGIDTSDYENQPSPGNNVLKLKELGKKLVIFVGRITFQKGPDYFLQAAKKVLEVNPDVIFMIVGSGDMEQQIIRQAADLEISDKILFAGFQRGEELNQIYRAADLFVLSSVSEPFGITTLESMVNGTPVLISNQSGVAEALKNALKVDFWDIEEMANKMLAVLQNPALYNSLSSNGQEEAKRFTWQKAAQKCLGIYQQFSGLRFFKNGKAL